MQSGSSHVRKPKSAGQGRQVLQVAGRQTANRAKIKGDGSMQAGGQSEGKSGRLTAVAAHPLAELLDCPPEAGSVLAGSSECIQFDSGQVVFRQGEPSKGLYLVVSGHFQRRAERLNTRLVLGTARTGELVELAAALGECGHNYTLSALTPGSLLLLPIHALQLAFEAHPPLRMRLLEELAREVSRAYLSCCQNRAAPRRRREARIIAD
jgi:signal-transduction protein with cAMP-binding, CBS, and nucleotidyltransferase domain